MSLKNLAKLVKEATKTKDVAEQFLFDLNDTIVRLDLENSYIPSKTYKPSMLGGCLRQIFFLLEDFSKDNHVPDASDASGIGISESGTDRHERLQKAIAEMRRMGKDVEWIDVEEYLKMWPQPGVYVKKKDGMETHVGNSILNMSFKCDGILRIGGKYFILEIKTEASFKWNGRVEPVDRHKIQAASYAANFNIFDVIFIYENRDFCTKKAYHYQVTQQEVETWVISRIEEVENHRRSYKETNVIPEKSTSKTDCKYCDYTDACKEWYTKYGN